MLVRLKNELRCRVPEIVRYTLAVCLTQIRRGKI